MGTFTNSVDPDEMPHYTGSPLFVMVKKHLQTKNTIFLENYNLTPLDMYNGLSQVYCIEPKGRIL